MKSILKRTTAIAALAALPLAPVAVHAQAQQGQQGQGAPTQSELVPTDKEIDVYKSQKDTAPPKAEVVKTETGEYKERTAEELRGDKQAEAAQQTQEKAQQQGEQQAEGELMKPGNTPEVIQGQNTSPGVAPGAPPAQEQMADQVPDVLIATVGTSEIRRSDVLNAIGMLPPQLQQQPPEMLIPMALDQLVLRELILEKAREAGLDEDPDVTAKVENESETARENAMVQVWLDRELGDAVTDEAVQSTYDAVSQTMTGQMPPLEQVRPQIEEQLRQQAFMDLGERLQQGAEITLYGPDGQPLTQ